MYPENPEGIQVIVGSMNMGYISDTARNRTHNLFRPKREPIPLGHSDGFPRSTFDVVCRIVVVLILTDVCGIVEVTRQGHEYCGLDVWLLRWISRSYPRYYGIVTANNIQYITGAPMVNTSNVPSLTKEIGTKPSSCQTSWAKVFQRKICQSLPRIQAKNLSRSYWNFGKILELEHSWQNMRFCQDL